MTAYDFDTVIDRRQVPTSKWDRYPADVLPMWVADMDFAVAAPIVEALRSRLDHPVFGYGGPGPKALRQLIAAEMKELYDWTVAPESVVFLPGVVPGFNVALKALVKPAGRLVVETPVYPPILAAAAKAGLERVDVEVKPVSAGSGVDLAALTGALRSADAFLLCNPHNPTGRMRSREELLAIGEAAEAANALIISDEIHCDIVFSGRRHIPIASLSPAVEARTITLMAASKTYNIAGLKSAYAIIPNAELRHRFEDATHGLADGANVLGLVASEAALRHARPWKQALLAYLEANRDHLVARIKAEIPEIKLICPEATFLAWLDCSALELGNAYAFFLEKAHVAFNPGPDFGADKAHVRFNFGCPRVLLDEGMDRMVAALRQR